MGYKAMNREFLRRAEACKPVLSERKLRIVNGDIRPLREGDSQVFDFGDHLVGYLNIRFSSEGSHPDAPALVRLRFGETRAELEEDTSDYRGWISKGWLQEEIVHLDVLPCTLRLPRRYAFRFVRVEVLAVSQKYSLTVQRLAARAVTSAPEEIACAGRDPAERRIDEVALKTLSECMQYEFEDGPKRDRRLWLGDLRLQALANYETFRHNDLVKRCLYLFAGTAQDNGRIAACVFTKPKTEADDTFMFDYSLLFIPALEEYYAASGDRETAESLYPLAVRQLDLSEGQFDGDLVRDSDVLGWCFLDWDLSLNKQAGAQAVYLCAAKAAARLGKALGKDVSAIEERISRRSAAAVRAFYDEKAGLFVSGAGRQISYASNVWFVLAGVFSESENAALLQRLGKAEGAVRPVTPYMYHYYVQAQLESGLVQTAREVMVSYWGAMAAEGADTFYELFDPSDPSASPYGSHAANSYCHAWSCTPSYFLRKYFTE